MLAKAVSHTEQDPTKLPDRMHFIFNESRRLLPCWSVEKTPSVEYETDALFIVPSLHPSTIHFTLIL